MALALTAVFEGVLAHRLLDRLVRGRVSIALVAFALIGIVTLQLGLLKLNGGIGRALEREAVLQRQNATLSIENSELAAGDRVQSQAARIGMQLASPRALRFLQASPYSDPAHGAAALRAPVHTSTASTEAAAGSTGAGASSAGGSSTQGASAEAPASTGASEAAAPAGANAAAESPAGSSEGAHGAQEAKPASTETGAPTPAAPASGASAVPSTGPAGGASGESSTSGGAQAAPQG